MLPPVPEPLPPPAASTSVTVPVVLLLPDWPVALAAPVVELAVPVLVTVLLLVKANVAPEVAPSLAPPVEAAVVVPTALLMVVRAVSMPSPSASPLSALALSWLSDDTVWLLAAVVAPPPPEPALPPPAASTAPTVPVVVLSPAWPMAVAAPLVLVAVPEFDTRLVLVMVNVVALLEPAPSAPPVVDERLPPLAMLVSASEMPSPLASPLSAMPLSWLSDDTSWVLLAVVAPLPAPVLALPPPAASTVATEPVVLLLPAWPVADAAPEVLVAVPVLLTALVLVTVTTAALEAPSWLRLS